MTHDLLCAQVDENRAQAAAIKAIAANANAKWVVSPKWICADSPS